MVHAVGRRHSSPDKGRNVIERGFNVVKQWRGLATRYDKLAIVYRGAAVYAPHHLGRPFVRHALVAVFGQRAMVCRLERDGSGSASPP